MTEASNIAPVAGENGVWALTATITNRRGLHARAAAKFVKCASAYDADISVTKGEQTVNGSSIMGLMMLAAATGCSIDLHASGPEAQGALSDLADLIARKFDED